jgi:hypothetical protein
VLNQILDKRRSAPPTFNTVSQSGIELNTPLKKNRGHLAMPESARRDERLVHVLGSGYPLPYRFEIA